MKCGKTIKESTSDVSFTVVCLQTSQSREKLHEINGEVLKDAKIKNCVCSCKAGLGEKCKHSIATLLYCYRQV